MKFTKMHGAGNDFVVIDNRSGEYSLRQLSEITANLCRRRLSVGADGLMAVTAAVGNGDYGMLYFNADGSLGEMCGNGARCIARYGYDHGLAGETQRIESSSGLVVGRRISEELYEIRLNDPTVLEPVKAVTEGGQQLLCSYVELGNPGLPHAVFGKEDWTELPRETLLALGRSLRFHSAFPKGANVTFWRQLGSDHFQCVTYERGVEDFTLACGTGAGSTAAALTLHGLASGRNVRLCFPGGELSVTLTAENGGVRDIYLTGPAKVVAVGECYL